MRKILRAIYVAGRALRCHVVRRVAAWIVGSSQYQTVRFDGLTVRDFADGGLLYLKLMGELDWYREMRQLAEKAAVAPVILDIGGNVGAVPCRSHRFLGHKSWCSSPSRRLPRI